jgi:AraC-like DNA-binding protein
MELLYPKEHTTCFNYNSGDESLMQVVRYEKGKIHELNFGINNIIFIIKGRGLFSLGMYTDKPIQEEQIVICPANQSCTLTVQEDMTLLLFCLNMNLSFCDHFSFEMLLNDKHKKISNDLYLLNFNEAVKAYVQILLHYLEDGLRCTYFLEIKMKEFLYILRAYYPKEELKTFFNPILNNDLEFSLLVFQHYQKAASVKDLAQVLNYSLSGFEKRFKRAFGISVYQWIQTQRAKNIYHEINCSNKTFTELGFAYGFSSPSHFNDFCKKVFNDTPGNLRKKYLKKIAQ